MKRFAVPGGAQVSVGLKEIMLLHNYRTVNYYFLVGC